MTDNGTVDQDEIERFGKIGAEWWDPEGPMRPLHKLTPFRTAWIWQQCATAFDRAVAGAERPLDGLPL